MNKDNTIYYQQKKHHREQLRAIIDPKTIDDLEVNPNPSIISKKQYLSMYKHELQKQNQTKNSPVKTRPGKSDSVFANAGAKLSYPDYHHDKYDKIGNYIDNNFDGGSNFFRASENYEKNIRNKQTLNMRQTLNTQLYEKNMNISKMINAKELQKQLYQKELQNLQLEAQQNKNLNKEMKQNRRNQQLKQIEHERSKKKRNSNFNYNNIERHNPITNPIQYHIDNPYILKSIQESKMRNEY